ncbi:Cyclic nucleotide-binding domain-containing protein 2 [Trichoplax sp. H2]|nr:Cyclic nucleotide-binding domain-containing protein 2 [Trichoplax sp. H2]|eukprot:RDD41421.1 Cyclic nucleotide-binding domain-containing protein 2 [Trichoplax sp. H2]
MNSRPLLSPLSRSPNPSSNRKSPRLDKNHHSGLRRSLRPLYNPTSDIDSPEIHHHLHHLDWYRNQELSTPTIIRGSFSSSHRGSVRSIADDCSTDGEEKKKLIKPLRSISKHHRTRSGTLPSNPKRFTAKKRFRKATRFVLMVIKIKYAAIQTNKYSADSDELPMENQLVKKPVKELIRTPGYFVSTGSSSKRMPTFVSTNRQVTFDFKQYKAKREMVLNKEVKLALSQSPQNRGKEQLQMILFALQTLECFSEYPLDVQREICRVGWLLEVLPEQTLIRQGYPASYFYIIISGMAKVTQYKPNALFQGGGLSADIATLSRGQTFGETALLYRRKREYTITCVEKMQLIAIDGDDFNAIFLREKEGQAAEYIQICSQLECMKNWPIEKLTLHPDNCKLHYFRRGCVIVEDSKLSDWIYVIRSGSCSVVVKMKPTKPYFNKKKTNNNQLNNLGECLLPSLLPYLKNNKESPKDDEDEALSEKNANYPAVTKISSLQDNQIDKTEKPKLSRMKPSRTLNDISVAIGKPVIGTGNDDSENNQAVHHASLHGSFYHTQIKGDSFDNGIVKLTSVEHTAENEGNNTRKLNRRRALSLKAIKTCPEVDEIESERNFINSQINNNERHIVVQIELLKPKDCFGLSTLEVDKGVIIDRPSLSLVSNGSECIMISKEFYLRYANDDVKSYLRSQIESYPSEDSLQQMWQDATNWKAYKNKMLEISRCHQYKRLY